MVNDLVSIIVPAYNVEKNIPYCLDSLINQTYKNIEIICVNDGSKDNTKTVIESYVAKDSRIRLISQENSGVSAARNTALDAVNGEYIAFVDSDDYVSETFIERLLELISDYSADIARCRGRGVKDYDYSEPISDDPPIISERNTREALEVFYDGIFYGWYADDASVIWNCLYRTKVIKLLRFDKNILKGEDECFIQKAIGEAKKIVYTDERLYFYYYNENSLTHTKNDLKESLERIYLIYSSHKNYFIEKGFDDIRSKSCEYACNNICEIYVDANDRNIRKQAKKYFKKFFDFIDNKPIRLVLFRYFPNLYKLIIRLKYKKTA